MNSKGFWLGFFLGSVAGFVAALLSAPESGHEMRKDIRARGIELRSRAVDLTDEAQTRAQELQKRAVEVAEEKLQKVEQAVSEGRGQAEAVVAEVSDRARQSRRSLTLEFAWTSERAGAAPAPSAFPHSYEYLTSTGCPSRSDSSMASATAVAALPSAPPTTGVLSSSTHLTKWCSSSRRTSGCWP